MDADALIAQFKKRYGAAQSSRKRTIDDEILERVNNLGSTPATQEKKGRGGLNAWLPTIGAIGGGLLAAPLTGGASLAAALLAAGAGSALGAGVGELAAQNRSGENLDLGKIGKEAGLSGALGIVGGGAGSLVKAGRAGIGAKAALSMSPKELQLATQASRAAAGKASGNVLQRTGNAMRESVFNPAAAFNKSQATPFIQNQMDDIANAFSKTGLKGSATSIRQQLPGAVEGLTAQQASILKASKVTKPVLDLQGKIQTNLADRLLMNGPADEKLATRLLSRLNGLADDTGKISASNLNKFRQGLNKELSRAYKVMERGNPLSTADEIRLGIKESVDDILPSFINKNQLDSFKEVNQTLRALNEGSRAVFSQSQKTMGVPLLGVKSRLAERGIQSTTSKVGGGLLRAGNAASRINRPMGAGQTPSLVNALLSQTLGRNLTQASGNMSPSIENNTVAPTMNTTMPDSSSNISSLSDTLPDMSSGQAPLIPKENLLAAMLMDLEQTGGKNISDLKTIYELSSEGSGGGGRLGVAQQKDANNAMSALQDLQVIRSEITRDPRVAGKASLPFDSLTNRITGAGQFESAKNNVADALARLRTGAAITDFEFQQFSRLLPQSFDDPRLINDKLARLESLFARFANPQPAGGSLEEALMGAGGEGF